MPGPVKKEIMLCLRDIALDEQNIRYHEYTDGIISGCRLVEESMKIGLLNGIVKFAGRLYRLNEKALISYEPTENWTVLKLRFNPQTKHREYIHYTAELALDENFDIKPNEMEMGRFKLKKRSVLRTEYTDFWDMVTEYDTVNLIHVKQSLGHTHTLSPVITRHFAKEAFRYLKENPLDFAFCTACLAAGEPVSRELIQQYVCKRLNRDYKEMSNTELHEALSDILDIVSGKEKKEEGKAQNEGIMFIY